MAFKIPLSQVTEDELSTLVLTPIVNEKYQRSSKRILLYRKNDDSWSIPMHWKEPVVESSTYPAVDIAFTGSLYERQVGVVEDAYKLLIEQRGVTLALYPGFGKTVIAAYLASRLKLVTCVLVNRKILLAQWKKTFERDTTATVWIVGERQRAGSGRDEKRSQSKEPNVILCMKSRYKAIENRAAIGLLIIDEAHTFCTRGAVDCLLSFTPKYVIAETATPERDDGMHEMMTAICGRAAIYKEAEKKFIVHKIYTGIRPERTFKNGTLCYQDLVKNTLHRDERDDIIIELIGEVMNGLYDDAHGVDNSVLVLTSLVDHVHRLLERCTRASIPCDYMCGNKSEYTEQPVLIGTIPKIGTGFDQATACQTYRGKPFNVLIIACSMKKLSLIIQTLGRVFRSDWPRVFYLVDDDNVYKRHWKVVEKCVLDRGATIITRHKG
jgi:superfamily II DNA or RNA helicase